MRISDSVMQSQAQFGVRSAGIYSNVPNVELDNVYFEVADAPDRIRWASGGRI